jgi:hypothetical protein
MDVSRVEAATGVAAIGDCVGGERVSGTRLSFSVGEGTTGGVGFVGVGVGNWLVQADSEKESKTINKETT